MTWVWNLLGPEFLEYPQILPKDEDEDKWGIHKTLDLSCGSLQENTSFTLALLIFSTDVTILLMHLFESKLTTSVVISIPLCCRAWLRRVLKFCRSNTPYVVFFPPFCIPNFQYGQNDGNFCNKQFLKARKWKKRKGIRFPRFPRKIWELCYLHFIWASIDNWCSFSRSIYWICPFEANSQLFSL